jgi:hypothetical protein
LDAKQLVSLSCEDFTEFLESLNLFAVPGTEVAKDNLGIWFSVLVEILASPSFRFPLLQTSMVATDPDPGSPELLVCSQVIFTVLSPLLRDFAGPTDFEVILH